TTGADFVQLVVLLDVLANPVRRRSHTSTTTHAPVERTRQGRLHALVDGVQVVAHHIHHRAALQVQGADRRAGARHVADAAEPATESETATGVGAPDRPAHDAR